jgi:hypothetical protein
VLDEHLVELKFVEHVAEVVEYLLGVLAGEEFGDLPLAIEQSVAFGAELIDLLAKLALLGEMVERAEQSGLNDRLGGFRLRLHGNFHLSAADPLQGVGGCIFSVCGPAE